MVQMERSTEKPLIRSGIKKSASPNQAKCAHSKITGVPLGPYYGSGNI